jgi:hypothetical protein
MYGFGYQELLFLIPLAILFAVRSSSRRAGNDATALVGGSLSPAPSAVTLFRRGSRSTATEQR